MSQNLLEYLKEKYKTTQFYKLKIGETVFISYFDGGLPVPEFIKLIFKKFNNDILLIVNVKRKEVTVIKNITSSVDETSFIKRVFGNKKGTTLPFTQEFLALTKHFNPYDGK